LIAKRETELDTWWKLDSECDCKENSTEQQCKDNNVIAKSIGQELEIDGKLDLKVMISM
jgi:hypothetical protein